jgi:hypothetical protein
MEGQGMFLAVNLKEQLLPGTFEVIIVFETLLRPIYPGKQTLVNDWANFTVYLTFFILGYCMAITDPATIVWTHKNYKIT